MIECDRASEFTPPETPSVFSPVTDCYLREPVLDYKMGKPFTWWAEHHSRYPAIAQIANHYLTATATSGEVVFFSWRHL